MYRKVSEMRYRSDSGALWGLFSSTDRQRHDILTRTHEGIGHVAIPVHPDERAWLREQLAKVDDGQPEPKRAETPTQAMARLMYDVLKSLEEHGEVFLDPDDPIIEEARRIVDEEYKQGGMPWNGGL